MKRFFIATCVVALVLSLFSTTAKAQTTKQESPWQVEQTVIIPEGQTVFVGTTRTGNEKCWFTFKEIGDVTVSPTSAKKYQNGEVQLELVKWTNKETGKIRYSVRQHGSSRGAGKPNVDISALFGGR